REFAAAGAIAVVEGRLSLVVYRIRKSTLDQMLPQRVQLPLEETRDRETVRDGGEALLPPPRQLQGRKLAAKEPPLLVLVHRHLERQPHRRMHRGERRFVEIQRGPDVARARESLERILGAADGLEPAHGLGDLEGRSARRIET